MAGRLAIPVLLVAATVAIFAPVRDHDFVVWDDDRFVYQNPDLQPPHLSRIWQRLNPLTNTTYALLAMAGPPPAGRSISTTMDPRPFHIANLVLHVAAVLVVWTLLQRLGAAPWSAAAAALLFAVHPVQVEPVAWVSGLKDVLSGLLALVALERYAAGRRATATVAFLLALCAKPTAAVVPVVAWVLDVTLLRRPWRASLVWLGPWAAAGAAMLGMATLVQSDATVAAGTPLWGRPLIAVDALAFYARQLVVPWTLAPDYGRTPAVVLGWGWPWAVALAAGAVAVVAGLWIAGARWAWAAAGVTVASLLPVLGLVPFLFQRYATVADRYLYLAMLGPALAVAMLVGRSRVAAVVVAIVLACFAVQARRQVGVWRDSVTLLQHAVQVNPSSPWMYQNLGGALLARGDVDGALAAYETAGRLAPADPDIPYNVANVLLRQNRVDEAAARYEEALRLSPDFVPAHYNLGTVRVYQGRLDEAAEHYGAAVRLAPDFAQAREALAAVEARRKQQ